MDLFKDFADYDLDENCGKPVINIYTLDLGPLALDHRPCKANLDAFSM